jgi:PEP-CTERM motif
MTALAATAIFSAAPAFASNLPLNQQTGPDLDTKIFASGDSGVATVGTTVYGNTSNGAGHNVVFSGYTSFSVSGGVATYGTPTSISITGGNGFAQVADSDFTAQMSSSDDLFALVMNPTPDFYLYEFSIQTLDAGTVSLFYNIGGTWFAADNNPITTGNGDTQYIFGDTTASGTHIDQVAIVTSSPINHVKQNSIQLTGVRTVPEPGTWALMLLGFAGVGVAMRRSRKAKPALMQVA